MTTTYDPSNDWHQCMKCGEHVVMERGRFESTCDCKPEVEKIRANPTRRYPGVWATRIRTALGN